MGSGSFGRRRSINPFRLQRNGEDFDCMSLSKRRGERYPHYFGQKSNKNGRKAVFRD